MRRWLALTFVVAFFSLVAAANLGFVSTGRTVQTAFPHIDKLGHLVLVFLLAVAVGSLWPKPGWTGLGLLAGILILEEFSQLLIPQRSFSGWDLSMDMVGLGLAVLRLRCAATFAETRDVDQQQRP